MRGYVDAEDWFSASPQVCIGCGALVHWNHTEAHDEWHERLEHQAGKGAT